tara:strand:+ start:3952 stop:5085 length:1134 start_codon:yes stop_codon:yes gene_type:complete
MNPYNPPSAEFREWGFIPWTLGRGTIMKRHQSILEAGGVHEFLMGNKPKHVYFSAGMYQRPGAPSMGGKNWTGSDLIFDLDADHLQSFDSEGKSYAEMLYACKEELWKLLDLLIEDFGFSNLDIVFSGGRGYHVHIRRDSIKKLDRSARREVVDYILGAGVNLDTIVQTKTIAGIGLKNPTKKRSIGSRGGWGKRVHNSIMERIEKLQSMEMESAQMELQSFDGIGAKKALNILSIMDKKYREIENGNIDVHPDFLTWVKKLIPIVVGEESSSIDEPVTTDIHRLIRLPLSLHGGTALQVKPVEYENLDKFDPLEQAIPDRFKQRNIKIFTEGMEGQIVEIGGETIVLEDGINTVPEYAAMFLMARGEAEKVRESKN